MHEHAYCDLLAMCLCRSRHLLRMQVVAALQQSPMPPPLHQDACMTGHWVCCLALLWQPVNVVTWLCRVSRVALKAVCRLIIVLPQGSELLV